MGNVLVFPSGKPLTEADLRRPVTPRERDTFTGMWAEVLRARAEVHVASAEEALRIAQEGWV